MARKLDPKYLVPPALGMLVLVGCFVFFFVSYEKETVPAAETPAPARQPEAVARTPEPTIIPAGPRPEKAQPPTPPASPEIISEPSALNMPPPLLARNPTPLDGLRYRVMAANPDLAQFRQLQRKVLPKPQEKEMLRSIYMDREIIENAKRDLLAADEKAFTDEGQFKRLYRVEYLGMGLEWKENPERDTLMKTVEELILAKNIRPEQDFELRRSLSGDKVELFMIMLYNDRKRAEELLARVQGTGLEKLLRYSMKRYDALWALADK